MSKETLSEIKKDLPIPNTDHLVHPKINPVIRAAKSFQADKNYGVNDHKLARIQDQAIVAACPILLTSAQRSAEVRALQRGLYFYISWYVCLEFVVYASLILDGLPFHASKDFN